MELQVPALIVQPLLENAIYHGIEKLPDGGLIKITGTCENSCLKLMVTNPVTNDSDKVHAGNRIAMDNISERLQITYGQRSSLKLSMQEHQCDVEIIIPLDGRKQNTRGIPS